MDPNRVKEGTDLFNAQSLFCCQHCLLRVIKCIVRTPLLPFLEMSIRTGIDLGKKKTFESKIGEKIMSGNQESICQNLFLYYPNQPSSSMGGARISILGQQKKNIKIRLLTDFLF